MVEEALGEEARGGRPLASHFKIMSGQAYAALKAAHLAVVASGTRWPPV